VTQRVKGRIGRSIKKKHASNDELPSIRDEALFKDPPVKEDCLICFIPMPIKLICCSSLPPATISSVPIADLAFANEELAEKDMQPYYSCCGKKHLSRVHLLLLQVWKY
jgi:hypothetical protein